MSTSLERPAPPRWATEIAAFTTHCAAAGQPPTTLYLRSRQLARLGNTINHPSPWDITGAQLTEWFATREWAPSTRRSHRSAYRRFWQWGITTGRTTHNAAAALPTVKAPPPSPHPLPSPALNNALSSIDHRVRHILRLATELGMRRGEIALAHSRDLIPDLDGWSLRIHGKGGRERVVPLSDSLATYLHTLPEGYWLPGRVDGHMSPHYVGKLASRALPDGWSLHAGRHRFATLAHRTCGDLLIVQDLLGHASPVTTRAYVAPDTRRARAVVQHLAQAA